MKRLIDNKRSILEFPYLFDLVEDQTRDRIIFPLTIFLLYLLIVGNLIFSSG